MYERIKPGHADRSHATVNFSATRYSYFSLSFASRLKSMDPISRFMHLTFGGAGRGVARFRAAGSVFDLRHMAPY